MDSYAIGTYTFEMCILCSSVSFPLKDSFLRALREVVPETELFLENHGQYVKNFVITLIYVQSCIYISPFYKKKLYLEEYRPYAPSSRTDYKPHIIFKRILGQEN